MPKQCCRARGTQALLRIVASHSTFDSVVKTAYQANETHDSLQRTNLSVEVFAQQILQSGEFTSGLKTLTRNRVSTVIYQEPGHVLP